MRDVYQAPPQTVHLLSHPSTCPQEPETEGGLSNSPAPVYASACGSQGASGSCCTSTDRASVTSLLQTKDAVFTLSAMTSGIRRNWIEALRKNVRPVSAPDVTK